MSLAPTRYKLTFADGSMTGIDAYKKVKFLEKQGAAVDYIDFAHKIEVGDKLCMAYISGFPGCVMAEVTAKVTI